MEPFCPQCRPVNEQLQAAFAQEQTHRELLRRLTESTSTEFSFPFVEVVRSLPTTTGTFLLPGDRLGFWATDPPATESFVTQLARLVISLGLAEAARDDSPSATLARWNAMLIRLRLEPPVMLGAIVGRIDANGGVILARAGLPPAILRRGATAKVLHAPGPYLGTYEAAWPAVAVPMEPGDELHLPGMILMLR